MTLRSISRRLAAFGLIGALALVLAFSMAATAGAQATPAVGGDTTLPETGSGTSIIGQATPAVGGDTTLPETGAGTTVISQATPAVGGDTGGDTTLPSTGTGSSTSTGMTGLFTVLAAAAAVVVAAVAGRTVLARREN